ncbi:MAG: TonB-dependent receptor [Candidatus Solibacter usitatus]|nr:TonB-dependent receptor [Candidatus Solibacter usitatus]
MHRKTRGLVCDRRLWALLCAFLLAVAAFGQESTGKITGTVTDDSGAAVPNAKITATGPTLPRGLEISSDAYGNFLFPSVPIGVYTVTTTAPGFSTVRQLNLEVKLGSIVTYNPKLPVGKVTETVEVTESATAIDTTSSRTATNIAANQFDNLAKGRTFNTILALAPGVRQEPKAGNAGVGGIQVDGASGSENVYYIDGAEVSDIRSGALRANNAIPFEFIQEVQIRSGGFEAEHGGATGGVINVATKSGTNSFHGQAFYAFTNSSMNAGDRGFWKLSPSNVNAAEFFRPKEDDYFIRYPGGQIGGPILKDRLFFFAGFAPELERSTRDIAYASGSRTFKQERNRFYGLTRVDYNPTSKLQVNTSWAWAPDTRLGTLPNRDPRVAAPGGDLTTPGYFRPSQTFNASGTYSVTPNLLISARYGYNYLNNKVDNYGLDGRPWITYATGSGNQTNPAVPAQFAGSTNFQNIARNFLTLRDVYERKNVYVDGSYVSRIGGQQHVWKAGWSLNRIGNDVEDDYVNGAFNVFWGEAYSRGSVTNQRGTYGYYIWDDGVRHNSKVQGRNQGFYVQDTWRLHKRLTLNLGVRFENEFLPPYRAEQNGKKIANPVSFGWSEKLAPRIGGAWDIKGDGKWKLSGSFGYFYDIMKYELARGSFGGDYWVSHVYKLDNPNVFSLGKTTPGALGSQIVQFDNRTVPINAAGELDGIDPDIKPYATREFTFTLDHQLAARLVAGIRYTHKDLIRTIEDIGVLSGDDEVYLIGNPGFGRTAKKGDEFGQTTPNGTFLVPKAKRQYDAVEFRLQGQSRHLNYLASYTWSRLYGNYSGLANSDETGRSDPGVSRAYDLPYYYFDATGSQQPTYGPLGTDRAAIWAGHRSTLRPTCSRRIPSR